MTCNKKNNEPKIKTLTLEKNEACCHVKEKSSPFKERWNATCNKKNKKPKA
jgi:hypothetical protein